MARIRYSENKFYNYCHAAPEMYGAKQHVRDICITCYVWNSLEFLHNSLRNSITQLPVIKKPKFLFLIEEAIKATH